MVDNGVPVQWERLRHAALCEPLGQPNRDLVSALVGDVSAYDRCNDRREWQRSVGCW